MTKIQGSFCKINKSIQGNITFNGKYGESYWAKGLLSNAQLKTFWEWKIFLFCIYIHLLEIRFYLCATVQWRASGPLWRAFGIPWLCHLACWAEIWAKQKNALPISASNQQPSFMHVWPRLRRRGPEVRHGTVSIIFGIRNQIPFTCYHLFYIRCSNGIAWNCDAYMQVLSTVHHIPNVNYFLMSLTFWDWLS